jgi:hypothetical protein
VSPTQASHIDQSTKDFSNPNMLMTNICKETTTYTAVV